MRGSRRGRCHEAPCLQEVPGQTPETWKSASSLKEHTAGTILLHPGTAAMGAGAGTLPWGHHILLPLGHRVPLRWERELVPLPWGHRIPLREDSHVFSRSLPPLDSKLLHPGPHPGLPLIPVERLSRNAVGSSLSFLGSCKAGIIVLKKLC